MKRILSVLLPLALAACGSPTALHDELVLETRASEQAQESATVTGVTGGVVVEGVYAASFHGFTLRPLYHLSGSEITLFVSAFPAAAPQGTPPAAQAYRVSIPLRPGTYTVRVSHFDQGTVSGGSRGVGTGTVRVGRV